MPPISCGVSRRQYGAAVGGANADAGAAAGIKKGRRDAAVRMRMPARRRQAAGTVTGVTGAAGGATFSP